MIIKASPIRQKFGEKDITLLFARVFPNHSTRHLFTSYFLGILVFKSGPVQCCSESGNRNIFSISLFRVCGCGVYIGCVLMVVMEREWSPTIFGLSYLVLVGFTAAMN